jgi:amino acid transporter
MDDSNIKLSKNLNIINVWSLALGSIIGWGCFVMPGNLFLKTAGPLGTAIGMIIGAIIMSIISVSYGYMIRRFPVAGGEFTFTFKGFGRNHAFICGWFLSLSYLSIVPLNATALGLIGRYIFPGILEKGYLYTIAGWQVYLGEILFASIALLIFAFVSIRGIKVAGWLQTFMIFVLVGSILLLSITGFFSSKTSFENLTPLFSPDISSLKGIFSIVAIAPWAYVGFDTIPQAAEEFNFSPKKSQVIMIISIFCGGIMYILMNTVTAIVFPWKDFISSKPYWATGTAVENLMGQFGLFVLAIALLAAILSGIIGFYMATSRLLFSLSRAKALPKWFSYIHPKYKTPTNSIIFVLLISLITPWFGRQVLNWVVDMASIGAAIGYFYTSASTFKIIKYEKGKTMIKIFSLLGSIFSLFFIILLVIPCMPGYLSTQSRILLIIWIILGIIFYSVSMKSYRKLTDVELDKLIVADSMKDN